MFSLCKIHAPARGRTSFAVPIRIVPKKRHVHAVTAAALQQLPGGAWWAPAKGKPHGICHFVGGAFAGAAPQVVYDLFLQLLSEQGYTVIATPYAITFQHADSALHLHEAFSEALARLRRSPSRAAVPPDAPIFGVGHSNGALVHLLMGSLTQSLASANVIISYNNKQVSDAIPIPGLLAGLGPAVQLARAAPPPPPPLQPFDFSQLAQSFVQQAAASVPSQLIERRLLQAAAPAIEQFGTVLNEVGDGTTDFVPSPAESRRLIAERYAVPSTLLVKFAVDDIDESEEMARILQARFPVGVEQRLLPGNHLTPCGSSVQWEVGPVYGPADAVLQSLKSRAQADVRRLVFQLADWMRAHTQAVDALAAAHSKAAAAVAAGASDALSSADGGRLGSAPTDYDVALAEGSSGLAAIPVPQPVSSRYLVSSFDWGND